MKKSLLMLGVAFAALSSCTKNEVIDLAESRTIGFDAFVGKSTRAVAPEETTLDLLQEADKGFYVYGGYASVTNIFDNTHVTFSDPNWGYSPLRYWVEGQDYKLIAYAPAMGVTPTFSYGTTEGIQNNDATLAFENVTVTGVAESQKDFVIAKSALHTPGTNYSTNVSFSFYHALSMIKVTLKNGFDDGVKLIISDFKITGINTQGDFTSASNYPLVAGTCGSWNNVDTPESQSTFTDAGITLTENNTTYANEFIVIPQSIGTVNVQFTVNVKDAKGADIVTNKSFNVAIPAGAWTINNRYHYSMIINGTSVDLMPIAFDTPTVENWGDYDSSDGTTIPKE